MISDFDSILSIRISMRLMSQLENQVLYDDVLLESFEISEKFRIIDGELLKMDAGENCLGNDYYHNLFMGHYFLCQEWV